PSWPTYSANSTSPNRSRPRSWVSPGAGPPVLARSPCRTAGWPTGSPGRCRSALSWPTPAADPADRSIPLRDHFVGQSMSSVRRPVTWLSNAVRPGNYGEVPMFDRSGELQVAAAATEVDDDVVIEGRSLRQIAWRRFKRDRVALVAGVVLIIILLVAIFASQLIEWYG